MIKGEVTGKILTFLTGLSPGETFDLAELVKLGLSPTQATTGMYRITKDRRWPVEIIVRGHLWRNAAEASQEQAEADDGSTFTFDVVEKTHDKVMLLADGDGWLWLAKRIGVADS